MNLGKSPEREDADTIWALTEAVQLSRELEAHFEAHFEGLHVALGGSVLYNGYSEKDVDLFIYPHKAWTLGPKDVTNALLSFGMRLTTSHAGVKEKWDKAADDQDEPGYSDEKAVAIWEYRGKRVDVFMPWVDECHD